MWLVDGSIGIVVDMIISSDLFLISSLKRHRTRSEGGRGIICAAHVLKVCSLTQERRIASVQVGRYHRVQFLYHIIFNLSNWSISLTYDMILPNFLTSYPVRGVAVRKGD